MALCKGFQALLKSNPGLAKDALTNTERSLHDAQWEDENAKRMAALKKNSKNSKKTRREGQVQSRKTLEGPWEKTGARL